MSHDFRRGTVLSTSQPHLFRPERNDLLGLLHEAHSGIVYHLLQLLDSDEARNSITEHTQPSGSFNLSSPFCVGRMRNSTGGECDLFLAPGVDTTVWPVYSGRGGWRDITTPVQLFARRGITTNNNEHRWKQFTDPARHVAQPRLLEARKDPHVQNLFRTTQPFPFKLKTGHWAIWRQIVWDQESGSFKSDTNYKSRIDRGDPDSPTISYCELTIRARPADWTVIICSAIAEGVPGKFRPWTARDPLQLPFGYYAPRPNAGPNLNLFPSEATFSSFPSLLSHAS